MKKLFLLLFVATFVLFTSCEKDAESEPSVLAQDLQNGFWESVDSDFVGLYDGTNQTNYYICTDDVCHPNFPCIAFSYVHPYTLGDNTITITDLDEPEPWPIKIEGDTLTINAFSINRTFISKRKETLGFEDCQ